MVFLLWFKIKQQTVIYFYKFFNQRFCSSEKGAMIATSMMTMTMNDKKRRRESTLCVDEKKTANHLKKRPCLNSRILSANINKKCSLSVTTGFTFAFAFDIKTVPFDCWKHIFEIGGFDLSDYCTLASISKYFKEFPKLFFWKPLDDKKRCLYPFHKHIQGQENNLYFFKNKSSALTFSTQWSHSVMKHGHYYCTACENILQCTRCVAKNDYFFTTTNDYEKIAILMATKKGNYPYNKRHPKNVHMICFRCKQDSVVKRTLSFNIPSNKQNLIH